MELPEETGKFINPLTSEKSSNVILLLQKVVFDLHFSPLSLFIF